MLIAKLKLAKFTTTTTNVELTARDEDTVRAPLHTGDTFVSLALQQWTERGLRSGGGGVIKTLTCSSRMRTPAM